MTASLNDDDGTALPDSSTREAERTDAILFGAMGRPDIRDPEGTGIALRLDGTAPDIVGTGKANPRRGSSQPR